MNEYAQTHSSVIALTHKNRGGASTINRGLQMARGEYVMIVDCDDMLAESSLDLLYNNGIANAADIVTGRILKKSKTKEEIAFDTKYITKKEITSIDIRPSIFQDGMYLGKLFKKELLVENRIFMDPNLLYADRPFVNIAQVMSKKILLIPEVTYYWRQRESDTNLSITDQENSISHLKDRIYSITVICDELKARNKEHLVPYINKHNQNRIFWHFKKMQRNNFKVLKEFASVTKPYILTIDLDNADYLTEYQKSVSALLQESSPSKFPWSYHKYALKRNIKLKAHKLFNTAFSFLHTRKINGRFRKYANIVTPDHSLVVFESYFGKSYSGNPRYIYEALLRSNKHFRAVWVCQNNRLDIPGQAIQVKRGSEDYYRYIAKAAYIVNNITFTLDYKAPHTTYLQTWHGTPLKRLGLDIEIKEGPELDARKNLLKEAKKWDYLIAANKYSEEKFCSAFNFKNTMLTDGYPANDLFKHPEVDDISKKIKGTLGIGSSNKKIILYAPTWRDNNRIQGWNFGFDLNLNLARFRKEFGDEYILLLRMHHLISDQINTSKFNSFVLDVSKYDDTHELLLISDILITDYSSIFFDYANLNRPMIFYSYDLEQYDSQLRGFYINPRSELPGPVVEKESDLINSIKNINNLEEKFYQKRKKFIEQYCSLEDGNASERIVDTVFTKLREIDGGGKNNYNKDLIFPPVTNSKFNLNAIPSHIEENNNKLQNSIKITDTGHEIIVFESFFGKFYGGEPKYIYEELLRTKKQFTEVWVHQGNNSHDLPSNVIQVSRGSSDYYRYLASAKYWVNNLKFSVTIKPTHTTYIQTWTGSPLKKIGLDIMYDESVDFTSHQDFILESKNWDVLIAGNNYSEEIFKSSFSYTEKTLNIGLPSGLSYSKKLNTEKLFTLKNSLGIPENKKVILYAPTFRETNKTGSWEFNHDLNIDLKQLQKSLSDEYIILIRLHSFVSDKLILNEFSNFAFDVSKHPDSHEIQLVSDILITDYSSILFEYANLLRPMIFYCHDHQNYKKYRDLYLDINSELPGPVVNSPDNLLETLESIENVKELYTAKLKTFKSKYCKRITSKTSKTIIDELFPDLKS